MTELLHLLHAICLAGLFAALCLGSGSLTARWLGLPVAFVVPVGFGCTSLAGMAAFCGWWFSPGLGAAFSIAVGLAGVALFAAQAADREKRAQLLPATPTLAAMLLLAASWLCLLHAGGVPASTRFTWTLPPDDQLPRMFADRIAAGQLSGAITGDWLASDRPPLQAGVLLLFRPFATDTEIAHETIATLCQLAWLPALAALGAALRLGRRAIAVGLLLVATSGFFLVNSLYTWPKLMAAALFVTALAAVIEFNRARGTSVVREAIAAGALLALAALAHGGVLFSVLALPALPAAWVALRRFGVKGVAVLAIAVAVVSAPWSAYKRFVDPPGNRLVKMHLAGVAYIDGRSSLAALRDAYAKTPPADLARTRLENAKMIVLPPAPTPGERWDEYLRRLQFFYLVPCVGLPLIGAGWLVLRRWRDRSEASGTVGLVGYSAATVVIWVALIFPPGGTIVHAGSYVPVVLLIFLGGCAIAGWRLPVAAGVVFAHCLVFLGTWLLTTPPAGSSPGAHARPVCYVVAVVGFLAFVASLRGLGSGFTRSGSTDAGAPSGPSSARP